MTTSSQPRVAAYLRISKDDQRSTSIEKQRANILAFAAARWPGAEVVEFVDRGVSATKTRAGAAPKRPAFAALTARLGEFDVVVFDRQDRIARRPLDFWTFADEAERRGTKIAGASEDLDLLTADGALTAGVRLSVAQAEARRTGERVRATNELRRQQGRRPLGGNLPYGLRLAPDGQVEPDPIRAPHVLDAADRIIAGTASVNSLAEEWTREGRPMHLNQLPRERRLDPDPPLSFSWSRTTIGRLLRKPALAGQIPDRGDVLRGADGLPLVTEAAALLPQERWEALQRVLDGRAVSRRPAAPRHEPPLLDGLVFCAAGHLAYPHRQPGRPVYYSGRTTGCDACSSVRMDLLDAYVTAAVLERYGRFQEVRPVEVAAPRDAAAIATVRREITRTHAQIGTAPPAEIAALATRLATLRETEERLSAADPTPTIELVSTGRSLREAYDAAETTEDRRLIVGGPLDGVVVLRAGRGGNRRGTAATPAGLAPRVILRWRGEDWEREEAPSGAS